VTDLPDKPFAPPDQTAKKSYSTPRLEVYGDLRKLTNTVANKGSADGGMPPTFRTH
jgi:hypothetical protein